MTTQSTNTHPGAPTMGVPGPGLPPGAVKTSHTYYDESGRRRTARVAVPVDQFGQLAGTGWTCPRCRHTTWLGLRPGGVPVCASCDTKMRPVVLHGLPVLPWRDLWTATERPLRAVWAGGMVAAAGVAAHEGGVPGLLVAAAAAPIGVATHAGVQRYLLAEQTKRGNLVLTDARSGLRHRRRVARRARAVGLTVGAATGWAGLAALLGVDPDTLGGMITWATFLPLWGLPAATWWRHLRDERDRPEPTPTPEQDQGPVAPKVDPLEERVMRRWRLRVAQEAGSVIGTGPDGQPRKAKRAGVLASTRLKDWRRLDTSGGWAATAVGEPGVHTAATFVNAQAGIASAFEVKDHMVAVIPDPDNESRAEVSIQRRTPIKDTVIWSKLGGPDSIDVEAAKAPLAMYADGTLTYYELWRRGWGTPHDFLCGTTGSGKSEALSLLLLIDRWTYVRDPDGTCRGLVANLLIDPQQGQSYGPFADDLAAPIATSLEEAKLMVAGLKEEMFRRNRYLANVPWYDGKGRKRKGRKWWDPLVDGPIITLSIDEAHEYLADQEFSKLVTSGARMYRKCGIRLRVVTHNPLLADLGGSTALRDMLTGSGLVWVGRTTSGLTGPLAFGGRLPVDPRTIPDTPGMAYLRSGISDKPLLSRTAWEPDFYDWVRDDNDRPIGYPAQLPPETLEAFGDDFVAWMDTVRAGCEWSPADKPTVSNTPTDTGQSCVDAVRSALSTQTEPVNIDQLDAVLAQQGHTYSVRAIRDALKKLRVDGQVWTDDTVRPNRHELTPQARERLELITTEAA